MGRYGGGRLAGRWCSDHEPGAVATHILRPLCPRDGAYLQRGIVPPAPGLRHHDEDGEELELPEKINGKIVYDRDGDFILGTEKKIRPDSECGENSMGSIRFIDSNAENVITFLKCLEWYDEGIILHIEETS